MQRLAILSLLIFLGPTLALAANIEYQLTPIDLADGYKLTGGFIETNGTIGDLTPSDILAFSAIMDGPIPYVFSSDIAGTRVEIVGSIVASAESIHMALADGAGVGLGLRTTDNSSPDCQNCHQDLTWLNQLNANRSSLAYDHHDHDDDDPDSGFKSFAIARPQSEFVIATFVEEPECVPSIGDIDNNGNVGFSDFLILSANFGKEGGQEQGDLDCDGLVDFTDFLRLSNHFGEDVMAASVPEPEGAILAICCLAGMFAIRRRR